MHSDMNAVLREGAPSGTYTLRININSPQSLDMEKVQNILEHFSNAQEVSIVFYEFPENYYEIFRTIPWKKSTHMTLSIWLYSTQFPYNFTMEDILSESKKMVLRNNGAMPL